MKKFFVTALAIIVTVLVIPAVKAFAADTALEDIPILGRSESGKAYCLYEEGDGEYVLTYTNSRGTKRLYKSKEKFNCEWSVSEDGKTLFYSINNTVYRYSYESGKRKKIYTAEKFKNIDPNTYVYCSPNGEYCLIWTKYYTYSNSNDSKNDFILWYDGKISTHTANADHPVVAGVNDKGEALYMANRKLYVLDISGGTLKEEFSNISDKNRDYNFYPETDTYIVQSKNDIYYGEIGGERHKLSFPEQAQYYISAQNGEGFIAYNGKYVARYNVRSGESKNILKLSPEKYWEKRFDFIAVSGDLDKIVYINYSKKKLVRLSGWNAEKNRYTKRQEIALNGTGREHISEYTKGLEQVLIALADEKNGYCAADFSDESFAPSEYWYHKTDRFDHKITSYDGKVSILTPDGSSTTVFDGVGITCEPWLSNGFFCFYSGGPDVSCDYEGEYDLTYYYINKDGKAVKWFEENSFYMECHYLEDWSDWE